MAVIRIFNGPLSVGIRRIFMGIRVRYFSYVTVNGAISPSSRRMPHMIFHLKEYFTAQMTPHLYSESPHRLCFAWHSHGCLFEPRLLKQILRFVARIYTVHNVELRVYYQLGWGCDQSIGSTVSDDIVRGWMWSTELGVAHLAT